jgi:hypothetical protein
MSPEAISTRLKRVSRLRRLCLSLAKAKPVRRKEGEKKAEGERTQANDE